MRKIGIKLPKIPKSDADFEYVEKMRISTPKKAIGRKFCTQRTSKSCSPGNFRGIAYFYDFFLRFTVKL